LEHSARCTYPFLYIIAMFPYVDTPILVAMECDVMERHAELRLNPVLNLTKCSRVRFVKLDCVARVLDSKRRRGGISYQCGGAKGVSVHGNDGSASGHTCYGAALDNIPTTDFEYGAIPWNQRHYQALESRNA
jgi:hypothetical protein